MIQGAVLACHRNVPKRAADRVAPLLAFHQLKHLPGRGRTDDFTALEFLHHEYHLAWRCKAESKFLVLRIFAGRALAAASYLSHDLDLFETQRFHARVYRIGGENIEHEIGCGVVAQDHHQIHRVAECKVKSV